MSILKFDDGIEFNTSGEYRMEKRSDGLYVVGNGTLMAVDSKTEGEEIIANLKIYE